MNDEYGYTQAAEPMESPGFSYNVGTEGGVHIDGTPMRLVTVVGVGILFLIILNRGNIRYHVLG